MSGGIIDFEAELARHGQLFAREDVIAEIRRALAGETRSAPPRWVLLLGGPGAGKSAILSHVIRKLPETISGPLPPHHLIRRGLEGWDRPEVVVQNLCAQIAQIFGDAPGDDLPPEERLPDLLKRVSKNRLARYNQRLIVVVDGLDELAGDGSTQNPLPRCLPRVLPAGVVFLCASRQIHPHLGWLTGQDNVYTIDLDERAASNDAACRRFWEHQVEEFQPPLDAALVDEAVRSAGGNLLCAVKLRDWLLAQPPERRVVRLIPQGLAGILTQIWADLHALDGAQLALVEAGLGVACAACEALPARLFGEVLGWTTSQREGFLRVARPFLREERDHWHRGQSAYRPYHECFREFIADKLGDREIRAHHQRLAATLAAWPPDARYPDQRAYALRHAVAHRIEAGDVRAARALVVDVDYLEAKCQDRELGVPAIERDLEATIRAIGGGASLDLSAVLAAVRAEASRVGAEPSSLPSLLYNRLRCAGWPEDRIVDVLRFRADRPMLRPLHGVRLGPALLRSFVGHEKSAVACAATPDGLHLLSASADRTLRLWALGSGECVAELRGHDDEITACALTADGRTAISASADTTARIWDLAERRCVATLDNGGRWATACAVARSGERAVVGSDNGVLVVWDLASRERVLSLEGHCDYVTACLFTADGRRLVSASRDQSLRVWSLETGACEHTLERAGAGLPPTPPGKEEEGWITTLALLPGDRQVIAAGGDGSLVRLDLDSGCASFFGAARGRVDACVVLHDGWHLLCGMADGTIVVWGLAAQRPIRRLPAHAGPVSAFAATPDGRRIASASYDRSLKLWEIGAPEGFLPEDGHAAPITACAVTPDGATVVSASEDRTLKVWDVKTGACRATLEGHADLVTACAISADGRTVVSGARDGSVRVWSVEEGRAEVVEGHRALVSGCAITPEGAILTASHDCALRLRSAGDRKRAVEIGVHADRVEACAVTPDGAHALSISRDGMARLWDLNASRSTQSQPSFGVAPLACALSPDGQTVVLGRENGHLEVRGTRGQRLHMLQAHTGRVFGCVVTPDGARVVSTSEDRTLRVWSLKTGECLATLHGTSWFRCVAATQGIICAGDQEGNLWMIADGTAPQPPPGPSRGRRVGPRGSSSIPPITNPPALGDSLNNAGRVCTPPEPEPEPDLGPMTRVLARLYPSVEEARMIASQIRLDVARINLTGKASCFWHAIIIEAHHRKRLEALVRHVRKDYREHRELAGAARRLGIPPSKNGGNKA